MNGLFLFAAASTGIGIGVISGWISAPPPAASGDRRRDALRKKSIAFRTCEPLVLKLAGLYRRHAGQAMNRLGAHLDVLGEDDWKPEEYVAAKHLEMVPVAVIAGFMAALLLDPGLSGLISVAILLGTPLLILRSVRRKAALRVKRIRGRLPYTLDLMALILEAGGGTLHHCLDLAANENEGHPLGDEFRRVITGIRQGATPTEVLNELGRRLNDPDISEVVLAITTAESRGLPLKDALRAIGDRLRTRQVQWLEKASEEAKVHITWPAMVVMAGCLLVVVAPMVLSAIGLSQ